VERRHQQASDLFSLLSHEPRLRILDELRRGEACVCHLQAILGRPQAYVSQQLAVLRDAGVVTDRREGLFVFYRLAGEQVEHVLEQTLGPAGPPKAVAGCPCPHCESTSS
jgi:ArsR family transcriptional regulator